MILKILFSCSVFALIPFMAGAAGTYYNYGGPNQRNYPGNNNPFYSYGSSNTYRQQVMNCQNAGYQNNNGCAGNADVNINMENNNFRKATRSDSYNNKKVYSDKNDGWLLNAGISHQFAMWDFNMKDALSRLHYDNIHWNVFDATAQYDFKMGNTLLRVDGGFQYGVQYGDSPMTDDDISGGGYPVQDWNVDLNDDGVADQIWRQQGHALSIGTSSGGDMWGLHAGLGLVDAWKFGRFKLTPSVGYRYFKYNLDTKKNYGMSLDTVSGADNYCQTSGGETQCLPFVVFVDSKNNPLLGTIDANDLDGDGVVDTVSYISVPNSAVFVETENTYYYYQDGISHSYEIEWAGPYLALDMQYDISGDDAINARVELGLPAYTATADQPYRPDWQHPKSLEDKGGIGDAYHFGLGANWLHSLTDSVMLTVGLTFDYYNIASADASTFLNPDYYTTYYYDPAVAVNNALAGSGYYGRTDYWNWTAIAGRDLESDQLMYEENLATIDFINDLKANGWKQTAKDEVESLYKSMGIRVGIQAKF